MRQAKQQMQYYLIVADSQSWQATPESLAQGVEELFRRPLKKDNPEEYIPVAKHREMRLAITGELLGHPINSFKDLTEPERRALSMFLRRTTQDVLEEVRREYSDGCKKVIDESKQSIA